jgi:hypothetical protein
MININFDKAAQITSSFSELASEASQIATGAKGIDAGVFSSYSPSTPSNNSAIQEGIGEIVDSINDFGTSFNESIRLYKEAYDESKAQVDIENPSASTEEVPTLSPDVESELRATIDFVFAYPKQSANMKKISDTKIADLLTKNGAKSIGDNTYELTIDGKTYQYNVKSHEIKIPSGNGYKEGKVYCSFWAKDGVSFSSITSTMTLLAGSSERSDPTQSSAFGSGNLGVGSNVILAIPYLSGTTYEVPYKIGGATRIADFMIGGKTRSNITNNIVGYSLGGMGAYAAVSANKGLYKNMAIVNGGPKNVEKFGSYANFKNVNIYIFEGNGDSFIDSNVTLLKNLKSAGVSMSRVHIYTTDGSLYRYGQKYGAYCENLDAMRKFAINKNHKGWSGHSHGYRMLEDSGIYSYFSKL